MVSSEKNAYDLVKLIFSLLLAAFLIVITFQIVEPFLFGFFWAVMFVITTWSLMIKLQSKLFNHRYLSIFAMTCLFGLVFIIPFTLIITSIAKNGGSLISWVSNLPNHQMPTLDWLNNIPLVGTELHQKWLELIKDNGSELVKESQPYIGTVISWILEQVTYIGSFIFHCIVMVIFSVLLYAKGEDVKKYVYHFAYRLSKPYGQEAVTLVGQSIKAVALGVVVTAIVLALIGGASFIVTNMPFPGFLTLLLFICCVAQIGPLIIMVPAIIWQFVDGHTGYAIILIVVAIILTVLDSLMRALLIKKGVDLPILLILFGVIGGLLAFGVMGLFIGPVVLALSYNLIQAWIEEQN